MINFAIIGRQDNRIKFINQSCDIFKTHSSYSHDAKVAYFNNVVIDNDKISYKLVNLPDEIENISADYLDNLIFEYELDHVVFIVDINELCSDNIGGNIIKMASQLKGIGKYDRFIQFVFITNEDNIHNSWKNTFLNFFNIIASNIIPINYSSANPLSTIIKFFNKFWNIDYPLYDTDFYPWRGIIVLYANINAWAKNN